MESIVRYWYYCGSGTYNWSE